MKNIILYIVYHIQYRPYVIMLHKEALLNSTKDSILCLLLLVLNDYCSIYYASLILPYLNLGLTDWSWPKAYTKNLAYANLNEGQYIYMLSAIDQEHILQVLINERTIWPIENLHDHIPHIYQSHRKDRFKRLCCTVVTINSTMYQSTIKYTMNSINGSISIHSVCNLQYQCL